MNQKIKAYADLSRPFTLLMPMIGMLSGAATAWGAHRDKPPVDTELLLPVLLGVLMAAVFNAANNSINQIYDLPIDRVNKPKRPLPSGRLTMREAWVFTAVTYVLTWLLAWLAAPQGRRECFVIVLVATFFTWMYSAPPLRTKRHGIWANVTMAVPRGPLLKAAGWSLVKTAMDWEPWFIGGIFGLYLLGASSTKDFADIEGDRADGCRTWPIVFGVRKAAWMITPFFIIPFALIPLGTYLGILTGNRALLYVLGPVLILYGAYISYLMVRRPEEMATTENHISWTHMYLMMMVAQVGFALAYIL
jgi:geranylgeranylglycerol-phosphate geranylgeranyltransferase